MLFGGRQTECACYDRSEYNDDNDREAAMSFPCPACGNTQHPQGENTSLCIACGNSLHLPRDVSFQANNGTDGIMMAFKLVGGFLSFGFFAAMGYFLTGGFGGAEVAGDVTVAEDGWVEYLHPENLFEAEFPARPRHETQTMFTPAGPIKAHFYGVRMSGGEYVISYFTIPSYAGFSNAKAMEGAVETSSKEMKTFSTEHTQFSGYSAFKIHGTANNGRHREAFVLRTGKRIYVVVAEGDADETRRRFLESVTILGRGRELFANPDKQPVYWVPHESKPGGYRCEFPQTPKAQPEIDGLAGVAAYVMETKQEGRLIAFHRDLSAEEIEQPQSALEAAVTALGAGENVQRSDVTMADREWTEAVWIDADQRQTTLRLLADEGRLFGMLAEGVNTRDAEKFFSEFRLLPRSTESEESDGEEVAKDKPEVKQQPDPADRFAALVPELASLDRDRVKRALERLNRYQADHTQWKLIKSLEFVMLRCDDRSRRIEAAKALRKWGTPDSVPSLIQATDDEWTFVGKEAMRALGHIGTPEALEFLVTKFEDSSSRYEAREALKLAGSPAIRYVGSLIRSSADDFTRSSAVDFLVESKDPAAYSYLYSATRDESGLVRMKAESGLKKMRGR